MTDCLHEGFRMYAPGVPGGSTCMYCGEVWTLFDERWDTWQQRIDEAKRLSAHQSAGDGATLFDL